MATNFTPIEVVNNIFSENYKYPTPGMFMPAESDNLISLEKIDFYGNAIVSFYRKLGIELIPNDIDIGSRVIRYVFTMGENTRVKKVVDKEADLALDLDKYRIRIIAPFEGASKIAIEIEREESRLVNFSEAVGCEEFCSSTSKVTICPGINVKNEPFVTNLQKTGHILISGATGMGKSILMNNIISNILMKANPNEVQLVLLDPKRVEFSRFQRIPHADKISYYNLNEAFTTLEKIKNEVDERRKVIENSGKSFDEYNETAKEKLPSIIVVFDEICDFMFDGKKQFENALISAAENSYKVGVHFIIATQRPTKDIITKAIRDICKTRACMKVPSAIDSKAILECSGAEKLLSGGDMLWREGGAMIPVRLQVPYISDKDIKGMIDHIADEFHKCNTIVMAQRYIIDTENKNEGTQQDTPINDETFLKAVNVALTQGQISTALLQRRLSIGFSKAARFIDYMEAIGIVSEKNGANPRCTLISEDEWQLMLHVLSSNEKTAAVPEKYSNEEPVATPEPKVNNFDFSRFLIAINIAINQGAVSTALLQRRLSIGFGKAAKFIDKMEEMGIVSEKNGTNPRNVLIDKETWEATLDKLG